MLLTIKLHTVHYIHTYSYIYKYIIHICHFILICTQGLEAIVITLTLYTSILKVGAVSSDGVIGTVDQGSLGSSAAHIIQVDWTTSHAKKCARVGNGIWGQLSQVR